MPCFLRLTVSLSRRGVGVQGFSGSRQGNPSPPSSPQAHASPPSAPQAHAMPRSRTACCRSGLSIRRGSPANALAIATMPSSTHHALRCMALQVPAPNAAAAAISSCRCRRHRSSDVVSGNLQWDRIIPKSFVDYWRRLEQQVYLPFSCQLFQHALSACSSPSPRPPPQPCLAP